MRRDGSEPVQFWRPKNPETAVDSSVVAKIKAFFDCFPARKRDKTKEGTAAGRASDCWNLCKVFGLICLALFFMSCVGGSVVMWFTDIYLDQILRQMTLKPGSQVFEAWSSPPVKPLICGYVFNYTNVDRYTAGLDHKIHVQEVGPYCYRETQKKKNITFNEDGTVTYGDLRYHKFEPSLSRGKQDDILIVPNLPLISAMAMMKDSSYLMKFLMTSFLKNFLEYSNTMIRVRAHDFFFGYDDKLIAFVKGITKYLPQDMPFEKFGLLATRTAVTEDTVTVRTGNRDLNKIGIVTEVNGMEQLDVWSDTDCNRIDGSDGAFFPRSDINETATLYLFHKDLCRRMPFVFDKEVDFQDGVMGMRFHASPSVYDTQGTCYCPKSGCAPNGVFDLSPCSSGIPIMMSFPHFLHANESVRKPFEGLHPDPEKHEFYIDIQRLLGFTLGTVSRLQLNIKVVKSRGMKFLNEFPHNTILPIVWIQVSAEKLPPKLLNYIYHSSVTVKRVQIGLKWMTLTLSVISGALIIYILWKENKSKMDQSGTKKHQEVPMLRIANPEGL